MLLHAAVYGNLNEWVPVLGIGGVDVLYTCWCMGYAVFQKLRKCQAHLLVSPLPEPQTSPRIDICSIYVPLTHLQSSSRALHAEVL